MAAQWQGPQQGIYQANNVIANYAKVNSTEELKNQSAGQAYFLRALRLLLPQCGRLVPVDPGAHRCR